MVQKRYVKHEKNKRKLMGAKSVRHLCQTSRKFQFATTDCSKPGFQPGNACDDKFSPQDWKTGSSRTGQQQLGELTL